MNPSQPNDLPQHPRARYVLITEELLAILTAEWSAPVRLKVTEDDGRVLTLIVQQSQ